MFELLFWSQNSQVLWAGIEKEKPKNIISTLSQRFHCEINKIISRTALSVSWTLVKLVWYWIPLFILVFGLIQISRLDLFHILVLLVYVNFKCELLLAVKRSAAIVDQLLLTVAFGMHEKTLKFVVLCERITSLYLLCNCLVTHLSSPSSYFSVE